MTNQHPITPPPELVQQLLARFHTGDTLEATWDIAFRAGADQELEACCEWLDQSTVGMADLLREYRRPQPPSLKEQALEALKRYEAEEWCEEMTFDSSIIRRALETLDD